MTLLFDNNYQPQPEFAELLLLVGMESLNPSENALLQINAWAQKNLLRQGERWEAQSAKFEELKPRLTPLLAHLGFLNASSASFTSYEGALIHGGLLPRLRLRLHTLVEQWNQGVRFSRLYFLTGQRPLEPFIENAATLASSENSPLAIRPDWTYPIPFPRTEAELAAVVWDQSAIPQEMRDHVQVHFISVPMKTDPVTHRALRPTTDDTVDLWLRSSPLPGRYLAVTNNPFVPRQDLLVKSRSPESFSFDTIGTGVSESERVAIVLDELARYVFQVKQIATK